MLLSSSSDDDDHDRKKPTPKSTAPGKAAAFLSPLKNGYNMGNGGVGVGSISSPNTPNMSVNHNNRQLNNAMAHMKLHNGDSTSMRSSFSASSESVSLKNYQQQNNRNLQMMPDNNTANSSFKSNSSANTTLNTPKGHHRNTNNNNRRQMPKRPGTSGDSTNSNSNSNFVGNGYVNNSSSGDEDAYGDYNANAMVQESDDDDEQNQNENSSYNTEGTYILFKFDFTINPIFFNPWANTVYKSIFWIPCRYFEYLF